MRTTIGELERAIEQENEQEKDKEARRILDLLSSFFRDIIRREGSPEYAKSVLPELYYDYIDVLSGNGKPEILARIDEADAIKFFEKADKVAPTLEEIRARLPKEYHD